MRSKRMWVRLTAALLMGWLITWVDSQPNWDDTGITVGVIFVATAALGLGLPEKAWLWALAVGGWIPLWGLIVTHNLGAVLALIVAFVGAFAGAAARLILTNLFASRPRL